MLVSFLFIQWLSGQSTDWIADNRDESHNMGVMYHLLPINRSGFFLASTQHRGSDISIHHSFGSTTVRNGTNVAYVYTTIALYDRVIADPSTVSLDYLGLFY